jgi:hypothetical protein
MLRFVLVLTDPVVYWYGHGRPASAGVIVQAANRRSEYREKGSGGPYLTSCRRPLRTLFSVHASAVVVEVPERPSIARPFRAEPSGETYPRGTEGGTR